MEIALLRLGVKLPVKISAVGGHIMFDDAQNTPNQLMSLFEFPSENAGGDKKKILQFEVRHWMTNREGIPETKHESDSYMTSSADNVGNAFYGSEGYMCKDKFKWQVFKGRDRILSDEGGGCEVHEENFIKAIVANDQKLAKANIEEGFLSCALVHLGNIAYRLGRSLEFDPVKMEIKNDSEANALLTRDYRAPFNIPESV